MVDTDLAARLTQINHDLEKELSANARLVKLELRVIELEYRVSMLWRESVFMWVALVCLLALVITSLMR